MEAVVKDMNVVEDRTAMETLFSYLDKGICLLYTSDAADD